MSFKDIFKKQEPKSKKEEAKDTAVGFLFIALIVWMFWPSDEARDDKAGSEVATSEPATKALPAAITLADFKTRSVEQRKSDVSAAVAVLENSGPDRVNFYNCMSDFAVTKSADLTFNEVLGWCEAERQTNRERFENHFDELASEEMNLDSTAVVMCKDFVKSTLVSPSTADFPWLDHSVQKLGKGTYIVRSYVDAQNKFGAMIRANYSCDIKYRGKGDEFLNSSWELRDLQID